LTGDLLLSEEVLLKALSASQGAFCIIYNHNNIWVQVAVSYPYLYYCTAFSEV
jgi:hypothetical protein